MRSIYALLPLILLESAAVQGKGAAPDSADSRVFRLSETLTVREIDDHVYLVDHRFPWSANALLVRVSQRDFILVDTPWENRATEQLVNWINSRYGDMNLSVINTHFHRDNLGGNDYLLRHSIPVYGSDLTASLLEASLQHPNPEAAGMLDRPEYREHARILAKSELRPPDHIFPLDEGLLFEFDWERVQVYHPGPAHTRDNVVVYFHNSRILFGGCMVKCLASRTLGYTGDADLESWPASASALLERFPACGLVVPGHGSAGDRRLIEHTLELLRAQ